MTPDFADDGQRATEANTADALAAHQAHAEAVRRAERIAESMRPAIPNSERRCDCGELIGEARLKVQPCARRCTSCATIVEQNYRKEWPL